MKDDSPKNVVEPGNSSIYGAVRKYLGVLLFDVPRFLWCMRPRWVFSGAHAWVRYRNRNENLLEEKRQIGVWCEWKWTSDLTIANRLPSMGRWLLRRALRDFPILCRDIPVERLSDESPDVSFLIGHRGLERLPLLLMTLKSIAGQTGCSVECIVVEQDSERRIACHLPRWVRYKHSPPVERDLPFSRSRAFNAAAAMARAKCVVFHDSDLLVPCSYAALVWKYHQRGFEVINLKRFVFYLGERDTARTLERQRLTAEGRLGSVMQNAEGGGSLGMDVRAYLAIGGFDDGFVGWGGEDNELWERAETLKVYRYGFLPMIHMWHQAQLDKVSSQTRGVELYERLTKIPPSERIAALISNQNRV